MVCDLNEKEKEIIKHLDLFSGIGGFALAAKWTSKIKTVGFCEKDKYCQKQIC